MKHHLAQVNIARMRDAPDSAAMQGLMRRIEEMNHLAEQSPGFIWRLHGTEVTVQRLRAFADYFVPFHPERLFYNLSLWESLEDLRRYAFETAHAEMVRKRGNWLEHFDKSHSALWWLPPGTLPTIKDSAERLRSLNESGPTPKAFNFGKTFPPLS